MKRINVLFLFTTHAPSQQAKLIRHYTEKHWSEFNFNMLSDTCFEGYEHFTKLLTKKKYTTIFFLLYHVNDSCYKKATLRHVASILIKCSDLLPENKD